MLTCPPPASYKKVYLGIFQRKVPLTDQVSVVERNNVKREREIRKRKLQREFLCLYMSFKCHIIQESPKRDKSRLFLALAFTYEGKLISFLNRGKLISLLIGRYFSNHLAPYILSGCFPRWLGETWIYTSASWDSLAIFFLSSSCPSMAFPSFGVKNLASLFNYDLIFGICSGNLACYLQDCFLATRDHYAPSLWR